MSAVSTEDLLGYRVANAGTERCADEITEWIANGDSCRWLACINPHSYAVSLSNRPFSDALRKADWLVPDGVGIVLASRFLNGAVQGRVTGSDIFAAVNKRLNENGGGRVFFLGASEETLAEIRSRMARDYPNIGVVGTYSPPFKPEYSDSEIDDMLKAINAAAPDVLWVGLTSPKQDLWIHRCRERLNVKFAAGIGAVFDFYTGQVKRSHPVFQRMGMEWLPRLLQEPKRLWRRMFVSAPVFLWHVLNEKRSR